MKSFAALVFTLGVFVSAVPASAQSLKEAQQRSAADQSATTTFAPPTVQRTTPMLTLPVESKRRPAALLPLYGAFAALQMGDAALTIKGLGLGAHEANGVMSGVVGHPLALYSLKAVVAGSTIFGAERLWRQGKRKSAVGMMVAGNILVGLVVNHNRQVITRLSR